MNKGEGNTGDEAKFWYPDVSRALSKPSMYYNIVKEGLSCQLSGRVSIQLGKYLALHEFHFALSMTGKHAGLLCLPFE